MNENEIELLNIIEALDKYEKIQPLVFPPYTNWYIKRDYGGTPVICFKSGKVPKKKFDLPVKYLSANWVEYDPVLEAKAPVQKEIGE